MTLVRSAAGSARAHARPPDWLARLLALGRPIVMGVLNVTPDSFSDGGRFLDPAAALDQAELAMLELTAERAGLADGQAVLDLGCGWGSLALWAAARFPASRFTAISNSQSQRAHIVEQARLLLESWSGRGHVAPQMVLKGEDLALG